MKFMKEGYISRYFIFFLVVSILEYALFHVEYLFAMESFADVLTYVRYYFSEGWGFLMPPLAALLMLIAYAGAGIKHSLLTGAMLSLSRIVFYLFYYYMHFIAQGFDSIESICFSLITSVVFVIMTFLEVLLYFGIGVLASSRRSKASGVPLSDYLLPSLVEHDPLDIGVTSTLVAALMSLATFAVRLVFVVYNTVIFLIENGKSYSQGELLSILLDYFFLLLMLILTHTLLCYTKKAIFKSRVYTED